MSAVGEGDAVAELYKRHAPALHRRCASIVGNRDEAGDLVQETFARYLASKDRWDNHGSAFAVLYRIATNASIDRLRRRKTASEDELDAEVHRGDLGSEPRRIDNLHDLAFLTRGLSRRSSPSRCSTTSMATRRRESRRRSTCRAAPSVRSSTGSRST